MLSFLFKSKKNARTLGTTDLELAELKNKSYQCLSSDTESKESPLVVYLPNSTAPTIHYTWIGPPADQGVLIGHDVIGPKKMAMANTDNPIFFWCLDKYVDEYCQRFKAHSIKVFSIEKFIAQLLGTKFNDFAVKMIHKKNTLLSPSRNQNEEQLKRDRVTLKDEFAFFLLITLGGYTLDTNVLPMQGSRVSLSHLNGLYAPQIYQLFGGVCFDVWMLYSPPGYNRAAVIAFNWYYQHWQLAERLPLSTAKQRQTYSAMLCEAVVVSISPNARPWEVSSYGESDRNIPELNVKKWHFCTHKLTHQQALSLIARDNNIYLFQQMVQEGFNISQYPDQVSLLENSIIYNRAIDCLQFFLAQGIKLDVKIKAELVHETKNHGPISKTKEFLPHEFALFKENKKAYDVIKDHMNSRGIFVEPRPAMDEKDIAEFKRREEELDLQKEQQRQQEESEQKQWINDIIVKVENKMIKGAILFNGTLNEVRNALVSRNSKHFEEELNEMIAAAEDGSIQPIIIRKIACRHIIDADQSDLPSRTFRA